MRGGEAKAAAARAWRSDKKLYLALGAVGAFLLALRLVMRSRAASDFIVHKIVQPYHRAVGWLCGFVPFSVAELCWAVLVLFCIWYVGRTVWLLARGRGRRLAVLWRRALGGVLVALSVYTGFTPVSYTHLDVYKRQVPYSVIEQMTKHPLTDAGIAKFRADYEKVFGILRCPHPSADALSSAR